MKTQTATTVAPICERTDFPWLGAHPEVRYLDNAATTQQPTIAIEVEQEFARALHAPVHRGMYDAAIQATALYEGAREAVQHFINAASAAEIIFTANATAALNLAAHIESQRLKKGDEILLSVAEHHSNILPWQRVAKQTGAKIVWVELTADTQFLDLNDLFQKLTLRTKVVVLAHASNVLGQLLPLDEVVQRAHRRGARVVADTAQTAGRMPIDVQALDVDYAAFSGHKLYGPTGIGWLYGKAEHVAEAEPLLGGGGSIDHVTRQGVTWSASPARYEAGTPHAAGAIGMQASLAYLQAIGLEKVWQHDQALSEYALERLQSIEGLIVHGPQTAAKRISVFAFTLKVGDIPVHSHDVVSLANHWHIALRGGHLCAQPLMAALGVPEVTRASGGIYTTEKDIDAAISALKAIQAVFTKKPRTQGTRSTSSL